jgi:hypothetical protein
MRTTLLAVATVLLLFGCGLLATLSEDTTIRSLAVGCGVTIGFVLGLGVGERSNSAYCRELLRVNRHLGELNEALRDSNLAMMRTARENDPSGLVTDTDAPG